MKCCLCGKEVYLDFCKFGEKDICLICNHRMEKKREEINISKYYRAGQAQMLNKYKQESLNYLISYGR